MWVGSASIQLVLWPLLALTRFALAFSVWRISVSLDHPAVPWGSLSVSLSLIVPNGEPWRLRMFWWTMQVVLRVTKDRNKYLFLGRFTLCTEDDDIVQLKQKNVMFSRAFEALNEMRRSGQLCDIVIDAGGRRIRAHKARISEFFWREIAFRSSYQLSFRTFGLCSLRIWLRRRKMP